MTCKDCGREIPTPKVDVCNSCGKIREQEARELAIQRLSNTFSELSDKAISEADLYNRKVVVQFYSALFNKTFDIVYADDVQLDYTDKRIITLIKQVLRKKSPRLLKFFDYHKMDGQDWR